MRFVKQHHQILDELNGQDILRKIELCGRICYKSEDKIVNGSAEKFVRMIIKSGHESVLEHVSFTVKFVTDRAVTHELIRHRLVSYSQESQRYVKYGEIDFVLPVELYDAYDEYIRNSYMSYDLYHIKDSCIKAENTYCTLIDDGYKPQLARTVLPNCTKTEIIVSANLREWRHILKLRTSKFAHPQIRNLMLGLLEELKERIPVVFEDIN